MTGELAHRTFQCWHPPLVWVCFKFSWLLPTSMQTAPIDRHESPGGFPRGVSVMALGVKQVWIVGFEKRDMIDRKLEVPVKGGTLI